MLAAVNGGFADAPDLKAVRQPMSGLRALAKIPVPGSPDWVAIGGSIWISNIPTEPDDPELFSAIEKALTMPAKK